MLGQSVEQSNLKNVCMYKPLCALLGILISVNSVSSTAADKNTGNIAAQYPNLQDPTRPQGLVDTASNNFEKHYSDYELSYITISNRDNHKALINGQLVSEGDKVGEALVLAIAENTVTIQHQGQQQKLFLQKTMSVKQFR